jgi:hypothetical protein
MFVFGASVATATYAWAFGRAARFARLFVTHSSRVLSRHGDLRTLHCGLSLFHPLCGLCLQRALRRDFYLVLIVWETEHPILLGPLVLFPARRDELFHLFRSDQFRVLVRAMLFVV